MSDEGSANQPHQGVGPCPAEKLAHEQRRNRQNRGQRVGQHMKIGALEIAIMVFVVGVFIVAVLGSRMAVVAMVVITVIIMRIMMVVVMIMIMAMIMRMTMTMPVMMIVTQ